MNNPFGIKTSARSYRSIESVARHARQILEIAPTKIVPGLRLFEGLAKYSVTANGADIPLTYAVDELPAGFEALTRYRPGREKIVITLSPESYADLEREVPRARFSLFHETGHALLHADELIRLPELPHAQVAMMRGRGHQAFEDSEWQANAFAGAMLMPANGIREIERDHGAATPMYLASQFGVSDQAASIRWDVYTKRRKELLMV
jgi:hypothetical protein